MTDLTKAQVQWLTDHPEYCFPGPPRPGRKFRNAGTLYADGSFEPMAPMKVVRLRDGCRLVAVPNDGVVGHRA
jgi:hypothetical protein